MGNTKKIGNRASTITRAAVPMRMVIVRIINPITREKIANPRYSKKAHIPFSRLYVSRYHGTKSVFNKPPIEKK